MGKIFVFVNQKGGVGKTTSAINIGAYMAELGKKVLLVDFDSQGNMTTGVGISKDKPSIWELIEDDSLTDKAIKHTEIENLDAISADESLAVAAIDLADQEVVSKEERNFILKETLAPLRIIHGEMFDLDFIRRHRNAPVNSCRFRCPDSSRSQMRAHSYRYPCYTANQYRNLRYSQARRSNP